MFGRRRPFVVLVTKELIISGLQYNCSSVAAAAAAALGAQHIGLPVLINTRGI